MWRDGESSESFFARYLIFYRCVRHLPTILKNGQPFFVMYGYILKKPVGRPAFGGGKQANFCYYVLLQLLFGTGYLTARH